MMSDPQKSLDTLGLEFRTDKSSTAHDYLNFYERYLAPWRERELTVLEVGVLGGASLAVWEAYFPNARIIGADIDPTTTRLARTRVAIEIIDQSNVEDLVRLGMKHGPFDLIIEDGSHLWEHQITTLRTLFPFVKNGGIYVVEDLHTNYGDMAEHYRGVATFSCVDFLKRLLDLRVSDPMIDVAHEEDAFLRTYGRAMHSMTFYRRACLIEKRMQAGSDPFIADPFVRVSEAAGFRPLKLLAHIGHLGDRIGPWGWLRPRKGGRNFQGFSIETPRRIPDLQYRGRLASGEWTEWCGQGEYAGTRGRGEDLTGFAVRLAEPERQRFTLQAVGRFAGVPEPVIAGDGEDCQSPAGSALAGMQIVLRLRGHE